VAVAAYLINGQFGIVYGRSGGPGVERVNYDPERLPCIAAPYYRPRPEIGPPAKEDSEFMPVEAPDARGVSYLRDVDAEFTVLEYNAHMIRDEMPHGVTGQVYLNTEKYPYDSCAAVIRKQWDDFIRWRGATVTLTVYWAEGGIFDEP
jgi:hypothetical protein